MHAFRHSPLVMRLRFSSPNFKIRPDVFMAYLENNCQVDIHGES
jgi:hypothetical protein